MAEKPYCPRCRTLMKHKESRVIQGSGHEDLFACTSCKTTCRIETAYSIDDSPVPQPAEPK